MYNPDTDLLFPPRAIPALCDERGAVWRNLVSAVEKSGQDSLDQTAFILMMARMNTCGTCNADSYRAMNGCTTCARQSLKRFHGPDDELVKMFQTAKAEVERYIQKESWY
jgi:hypothetical protein